MPVSNYFYVGLTRRDFIIMTSIEKLDFVLNLMNKMFIGHYANLTEIAKYSDIINKINVNELPSILNKLVKDGYADFEIGESKDTLYQSNKNYTITFEGKNLIENGGYKLLQQTSSLCRHGRLLWERR